MHFVPDDHYRTWPHPISNEDIESGIFLRSLSEKEEHAEFLATRGYCQQSNRRHAEAADTLRIARDLAPHNRHVAASYRALRQWLMFRARGHAFLNAPVVGAIEQPEGPFWITGNSGRRALAQIVSPVRAPYNPSAAFDLMRQFGFHFVQKDVRTPNGLSVEVWVPHPSTKPAMLPYWLRLSDGRYALVHQYETNASPAHLALNHRHAAQERGGHPASFPPSSPRSHLSGVNPSAPIREMPMHEQGMLRFEIEHVRRACGVGSNMQEELPTLAPLAIPAGPGMPRLT